MTDIWQEMELGDFAPFTYGKGLRQKDREPSGAVPVFGSNGIVGYHDVPWADGPAIIVGRKGSAAAVHYSPVPCWPIYYRLLFDRSLTMRCSSSSATCSSRLDLRT